MMDWEDWMQTYYAIVERLHLDPTEDRKATILLSNLLANIEMSSLLSRLRDLINDRVVVICGAGPSLKHHLGRIAKHENVSDYTFVAADGAVSALIECGQRCDIIVTDLDGNIPDLVEVVKKGGLAIVHAHGDNMNIVKEIVPLLGPVLGSTQVEPRKNVFLWGGFTDGDRACYVVANHSPFKVILAGMDFGDRVGQWSKPEYSHNFPATERKKIKLEIAKDLIYSLQSSGKLDFTLMK